MSAFAIEDVLAGDLSVERLLSEYWDQKPLLLRGNPDRFSRLFSQERLESFLKAEDFPKASFLLAYFDRFWNTGPIDEGGTVPTFSIPRADAFSAYEAGATVGVFKLEEGIAELRELCRGLRVGLGLCIEPTAGALWSPNGRGFGPHFDCIGTNILQIEGSKNWKYSAAPAIPFPVSNASLREGAVHYFENETDAWESEVAPASVSEWNEVTLERGDALFLPPGFWHTASADGSSLAITIQTKPTRMPILFSSLLRIAHDGSPWSEVPPLLAGRGIHGGPSEEAIAYLNARLDEALETLSRWRHDKREMLAHWIAREGAVDAALDRPRRIGAQADADPRLELSPHSRVISAPSDPDCLLGIRERLVRLDGSEAAVFKVIRRLRRFRSGEVVVEGLDRPTVDAALGTLRQLEILHVVP